MTGNEDKRRLTSIDLMKCIAIFCVLSYHSTNYSYNILDGNIVHYLSYFFRTIISPCVPIFFFVNGFLLFRKKFELKKHLKKVIHLLILTEIWNFITLLILMYIEQDFMTFREFCSYLFSGRAGWTNHLWYMGALICIYIFFPLLKEAYEYNKKVFLFFCVICVIMTIGNTMINEMVTIVNNVFRNWTSWSSINWFKMYNPFRSVHGYALAYFCVGGLANLAFPKLEKVPVLKRNSWAIVGMIISCFLLWGTGIFYSRIAQNMWDIVWYGYDTIFTFINVICIFILCSNWKKDIFVVRSIAQNTLGIYFIHMIFFYFFNRFVSKYIWITILPINLLYTYLVLMLSWLVCIVMRKIPIIRNLIQ